MYYIWSYEVLELLEKLTPEERDRLTGDTYTYMNKPCEVYSRAAFRNRRNGYAWATQVIHLLKKQFPERDYAHRAVRMLEDPMPPSILLTDD